MLRCRACSGPPSCREPVVALADLGRAPLPVGIWAADPGMLAPANEASAPDLLGAGEGCCSRSMRGCSCPAAAQGGSADGSAISSVVRFPARRCSPLLGLTWLDRG